VQNNPLNLTVTQYGCGCAFGLLSSGAPGAAPDHCPAHGKKVAAFTRPDPAMTPLCETCRSFPVLNIAFNNPTPAPHCGGCMMVEKECTCPLR